MCFGTIVDFRGLGVNLPAAAATTTGSAGRDIRPLLWSFTEEGGSSWCGFLGWNFPEISGETISVLFEAPRRHAVPPHSFRWGLVLPSLAPRTTCAWRKRVRSLSRAPLHRRSRDRCSGRRSRRRWCASRVSAPALCGVPAAGCRPIGESPAFHRVGSTYRDRPAARRSPRPRRAPLERPPRGLVLEPPLFVAPNMTR